MTEVFVEMKIERIFELEAIENDILDLFDYCCMKFVVVDRCITAADTAIDHFVVDTVDRYIVIAIVAVVDW